MQKLKHTAFYSDKKKSFIFLVSVLTTIVF